MHSLKSALSGQSGTIHTPAPCGMPPQASPSQAPAGLWPGSSRQNGGVQSGHVEAKPRRSKASPKNRFVKVRLSGDEYNEVAVRADRDGLTMCEHIRQQLLAVHEQLDVCAELAALRAQLATPAAAPETEAREALLLLRELAAARDLGILARVRAQLGKA